MSYSLNGSSNDPRVDELKRQQQQRQTRLFIGFALIEGLALAVGVVVVFVLELIDPEQGVWILVIIALLGGSALGIGLVSMARRHVQEMRDLTGH